MYAIAPVPAIPSEARRRHQVPWKQSYCHWGAGNLTWIFYKSKLETDNFKRSTDRKIEKASQVKETRKKNGTRKSYSVILITGIKILSENNSKNIKKVTSF